MNNSAAMQIAMEGQRGIIFACMLERYALDGRKIAQWDDCMYSVSGFYCFEQWAPTGGRISEVEVARRRRILNKLAAEGLIERHKMSMAVRYRMSRDVCDAIAEEAVKHYQAMGYSQDEIRPVAQTVGV